MAEYRKEMGQPPIDIDQLSALPPSKRRAAEKRASAQTRKDYPPQREAGAGRGFINPATIAQRKDADAAWDKLRNLDSDLVMASQIDRDSIPRLKKEFDAVAPALRKTIKDTSSLGYEPEGLPRTYAKGGKIDGCAQRGKTRGKVV